MKIISATLFIDYESKFLLINQNKHVTHFFDYKNYDEMLKEKIPGDIGFWRIKLKEEI